MFTVYPLLINLPYGIIRQGRPSQRSSVSSNDGVHAHVQLRY
jgi:hypothetical protein